MTSGGATRIGPRIAEGTLVLLGGRRALLRADGTLLTERVPAPEPLIDWLIVPSASDDRLIGHGRQAIYAFSISDPLGAATVLAKSPGPELHRIAGGPGWIVAWHRDRVMAPSVIDASSGVERSLAGWPAARILDVAFRTSQEGAVVFAGLGLAVTTDGGASFRAVPTPGRHLEELDRRGDELRASARGEFGIIDVAGARLGPATPDPAPRAPLLRWISTTGQDPLRAAVDFGIRGADEATALVAVGRLLARVRLDTGAVMEAREIPNGQDQEPCGMARRARRGFVFCAGQRPLTFTIGEDLSRVRLDEVGGPDQIVEWARLYRGSSGGLAFYGRCPSHGALCVLGPDGSVFAVPSEDLAARREGGLAPLDDGRLAWLGEAEEDPASPGGAQVHFEVRERDGATRLLPPFTVPTPPSTAKVLAVDQAQDGSLRAFVFSSRGVVSVRQSVDGGPAEVGAPVLAGHAILRDQRALRKLGDKFDISLDGGGTWVSLPAPAGDVNPYEISVGEIGIRLGDHLRTGWAGMPEAPVAADPVGGAPITWARPPSAEHRLVCKSARDLGAVVEIRHDDDARVRFDKQAGPPQPRGRREIAETTARSNSILVRLEALAPDTSASAPASWTLRWFDREDPAAHVRSARLTPPAGFGWGARIQGRMRAGDRFVVALGAADGQMALIDVPARGAPRVAFPVDVRFDEHTAGTIGVGDEDPVVIRDERGLWAWPVGAAPRLLAQLAVTRREGGASVFLAAARAGVVPVLLQGAGWAAWRALPMGGVPDDWLPLDGWQQVLASPNAISALPACRGAASGPVFRLHDHHGLRGELDGHVLAGGGALTAALYDVQVAGTTACLARVEAPLRPEPQPKQRNEAVRRIEVDLISGLGRAVESGPKARVRELRCTFE